MLDIIRLTSDKFFNTNIYEGKLINIKIQQQDQCTFHQGMEKKLSFISLH